MRVKSVVSFLAAVTLGACATAPEVSREAQPAPGALVAVAVSVHSTYDNTWAEAPFQRGAMSIVATERSDMRSFRLVPCHNGIVCAGSARGRHGRVEWQGDVLVVRGLYGRTFYLERGGDGRIVRHGHSTPLAWDSDVVLIGAE